MLTRLTNARIVGEDRVIEHGSVEVEDGRILAVAEGRAGMPAREIDLGGAYLVPGFIDVHVHPPLPEDLSDLPGLVDELSEKLARIGTKGILWTLGGEPMDRKLRSAEILRDLLARRADRGVVLGIHFEGPYISATRARGAFNPKHITTPEALPPEALFEAAGPALKYLSLSPDVPGATGVVKKCVKRGVRVGIGHSEAPADVVTGLIDAGASAQIHTFNNIPEYPMKEPGVWGAPPDLIAVTDDRVFKELICDGIHVDPVLVRLLFRAAKPDRIMVVTDSVSGGVPVPEGTHIDIGGDHVVRDGVGRLEDGKLAGSALTMERAFRNFVNFTGASLCEAVRVTSLSAARFLRMDHERGRIAPGYRADFAALDDELEPCMDRLAGLCSD